MYRSGTRNALLRRLDLRPLVLAEPHLGVEAVLGEQAEVVAAFGDAAGFEDQDLVGVDDGGQAVGDDQGGAAAGDAVQALLQGLFGAAVQGRGGLVEDQDRRVFSA